MLIPLVVTSIFLWGWFCWYTVKTYRGVPYCASESYYLLDNKGWYFIAVLFFQAVLLSWPILCIACCEKSLVAFIAGIIELIGILIVSFSPEFKTNRKQYICHFTGSIMGMVGSQVFVFFIFPWAFLGWIFPLGWKIYTVLHKHSSGCSHWEKELFDSGDWLWHFENGMFLTTYIALLAVLL